MAIKKTVTCKCNVSGEYLKINPFGYDNDKKKANLVLLVYKDQASEQAKCEPIEKRPILNISNVTSVVDAYTYLKTLPEYTGAIDV